jgi:hypothetical protein
MVSTERPSALLKRWPNPFSAFPSGIEKMLAGYSTVVPNSGTTNVCQSSAGWRLRNWACAPETADNAASVPASRYFATVYMVRLRTAAPVVRDGSNVNASAQHTFPAAARMQRLAAGRR